jgi:RNA polymerase sigma-70 factor (ECF subfamily)
VEDGGLVERARSGDLDAVQSLLERHQAGAYTAALRLLGEPADAEDVVQDALVRAYTRLDGLTDGASFGAWLRRIAVNLSLNLLRRRGLIRFEPLAGTRRSGDDPGAEPARDFADERMPTPEQSALDAALRDQLEAIVARLPAEQRVAVVLRDMYGYDVSEVASLQRCGLSAAKMRISRGRAELKRLALECGIRAPGGGT